MKKPLEHTTVAITEHRYTKEFSALFERLGARVYACPVLEETPAGNRAELENFVRLSISGSLSVMIFLTGVGARFLISAAESISLKEPFLKALENLTIVVRGPKPISTLRQFNVRVDITPDVPTTEGVIDALHKWDLQGKRVGVQLYGTPNPQLVSALENQGAIVVPVQVYAYGPVADSRSVSDFITKMLKHEIQAVAFTSAPQVRMLFEIASQLGISTMLKRALDTVTIASIGEVTNRALAEKGVVPQIVPKQPKMGSMVQAVADFFGGR